MKHLLYASKPNELSKPGFDRFVGHQTVIVKAFSMNNTLHIAWQIVLHGVRLPVQDLRNFRVIRFDSLIERAAGVFWCVFVTAAGGLFKEMILIRVPIFLANGLPLFGATPQDFHLQDENMQTSGSGLVSSKYSIVRGC